ncbi:NUDIX hydrolase [Kitasatospora sp. NPDC088134]|uniref:NUDIX hydrolase n=1 Tax=Kitasatospora sp. NPDC088134 TaxID=3364071 RepID=UPI00381BCB48
MPSLSPAPPSVPGTPLVPVPLSAVPLRRRWATVCVDPAGRVLVYRRGEQALVHPGWWDVLADGGVRAGGRPAEPAGGFPGPGLAELHRHLAADPAGTGLLTVRRLLVGRAPHPDPREVARYAFVPPAELLADRDRPLVPAARAAVHRLLRPTG